MGDFETEQERFWSGDFGNEYVDRNASPADVAPNVALFTKVLARTGRLASALELGANIGLNLRALRALTPTTRLSAVEINERALAQLRKLEGVEVHAGSLLQFSPPATYDLVLVKGVLIHIAPERLPDVYDLMYRASGRYLCLAEYYNPTPVAISYRGHQNKLFKRDFAGELLDRYPDLRLVDYGFQYHRDPVFPQDDETWFLLEKTSARASPPPR